MDLGGTGFYGRTKWSAIERIYRVVVIGNSARPDQPHALHCCEVMALFVDCQRDDLADASPMGWANCARRCGRLEQVDRLCSSRRWRRAVLTASFRSRPPQFGTSVTLAIRPQSCLPPRCRIIARSAELSAAAAAWASACPNAHEAIWQARYSGDGRGSAQYRWSYTPDRSVARLIRDREGDFKRQPTSRMVSSRSGRDLLRAQTQY